MQQFKKQLGWYQAPTSDGQGKVVAAPSGGRRGGFEVWTRANEAGSVERNYTWCATWEQVECHTEQWR